LEHALLRFEINRQNTRLRARRNILASGALGDGRKSTERVPACWSYVMTLVRIFGVLIFLSLAATGAALAGGIPNNGAGIKGDHSLPTSGPASARHARPQAPIVMGRSVNVPHKTKLHHIKMKPLESIETPVAADNSR
jgi:hypothetical protein